MDNQEIVLYNDQDELVCPICGRKTNSLKRYNLKGLGFYLVLFTVYEHDVIACPECMRKAIGEVCMRYILRANVLFPLVLLFNSAYYIAAGTKGHSSGLFLQDPQ